MSRVFRGKLGDAKKARAELCLPLPACLVAGGCVRQRVASTGMVLVPAATVPSAIEGTSSPGLPP